MGGRGRGRGRGANMSFSVEQLGFGRGEALPQAALAPPPCFPPLSTKPLPLVSDTQHDYMLVIKRELTHFWRDSSWYVAPPPARSCIERYSDRYLTETAGASRADRHSDTSRMPAELSVAAAPARKRRRPQDAKSAKAARGDGKTVDETLEKLEKREAQGDGDVAKEGEKEDLEASDEEPAEADDVELDEGNDYMAGYFDNGEDYMDPEDDALEEGPIF